MAVNSCDITNIPDDVYSHPGKYPFKRHVGHIAQSFDDKTHRTVALFHDLGKLNRKFQQNIDQNAPLPFHAIEGALFFLAAHDIDLDVENLGVFLSIAKHHGHLPDVDAFADALSDVDSIQRDHPDLPDTIMDIRRITGSDVDFDLGDCCDFFDAESFVKDNRLGGLNAYFRIKAIYSRLIFSDKFEAIFKQAFSENSAFPVEIYQQNLISHMQGRTNALSVVRNNARLDVMKNYEAHRDKRIFIIEAPTGIGKTFTALQLALTIAAGKNKRRIINALPMTSIIDQTYQEYAKVIDENVLLKFHHLTKTKDYPASVTAEDQERQFYRQKQDFIGSSWCLDNVIVTTFNQMLNTFYSNKNRDLTKFWTLRDSVVIFDEIQAIPRILLQDFAETLGFLSKEYNIDFVLMSATIPAIKNFLPPDVYADLLDPSYYSMEFNNRYALKFMPEIDSADELIRQIFDASERHVSVLSVVNTKKLALEVFNQVRSRFDDDEVFLLSTLFIPKDRKKIIKTIRQRLSERKRTILISTQVIEAGVDVDFDYGFREFAPFYAIIQTAGRINRENREEARKTAKLVVTSKIGPCPYNEKDVLFEEITALLQNEIRENQILPLLKTYFETAIKRTSKESVLLDKMKNLDFETVMKDFETHFMKDLPNIVPVFVEIRAGIYGLLANRRGHLIKALKEDGIPLEKTMEIKSCLKRLSKHISNYVVNVCKEDANAFPDFENEREMKVCGYSYLNDEENGAYTAKKGWTGVSSLLMF